MESGGSGSCPADASAWSILACGNMPRTRDCQVNENPFKIGVNSRNFARFYPLDREKIDNIDSVRSVSPCFPSRSVAALA
jgi:hypothetical protein